ncbi:MAG: hypothetical protein QOG34_1205, partial [Frankiaceae bacterium]|nr:hypothetical protein [Frankiaceae bacterium]
ARNNFTAPSDSGESGRRMPAPLHISAVSATDYSERTNNVCAI